MSDGDSGDGEGAEAAGAAEDDSTGFVLAIDIGGTKTDLATVAPDGTVLHRATSPTRASDGAERVVERAVLDGRELAAETERELRRPLLAVGAVCVGIVLDDGIRLAPNLPGGETLALAGAVRRGLRATPARGRPEEPPVPVAVGNDVKAAALAEARWGGLAGARCGIFLNLGTGLAASVVLDGRLLEGAHGAAGEIGYQLRDRRDIPAPGAVAPPGTVAPTTPVRTPLEVPVRAPLEEFVSGRALAERGSRLLGRRVSTAQVFEAADLKPELGRLVDEAVDTLAVHTANLATALDPDRIVVGGGLLRAGHRILPRLEEVLNSAVPFPPRLRRAHFAYDAPLHGAAVLALDATRDAAARGPSGRTRFTGPARR